MNSHSFQAVELQELTQQCKIPYGRLAPGDIVEFPADPQVVCQTFEKAGRLFKSYRIAVRLNGLEKWVTVNALNLKCSHPSWAEQSAVNLVLARSSSLYESICWLSGKAIKVVKTDDFGRPIYDTL